MVVISERARRVIGDQTKEFSTTLSMYRRRIPKVDASEITLKVNSGEVILEGFVDEKSQKRLAEDITQEIRGVENVVLPR